MKYVLSLLCLFVIYICHSGQAVDNNSLENNEVDDNSIEAAPRIIGGTGVSIFNKQYTYVARLSVNFGFGSNTICSGVVLSTKHILTVAHCVSRNGRERARYVRASILGDWTYLFNSGDILVHPQYDEPYGYDMAILRKSNWILSTFMRGYGTPPTLPPPGDTTTADTYNGNSAVIAGWGKSTDSDIFYKKLRYANVVIMDQADCTSALQSVASTMPNNGDELLCTRWNSAGLCAGDWGGPLLVGNKLVGLNLYRGTGSCSANTPSGYQFISAEYADWIRQHGVR